jgi:hypothetical protein
MQLVPFLSYIIYWLTHKAPFQAINVITTHYVIIEKSMRMQDIIRTKDREKTNRLNLGLMTFFQKLMKIDSTKMNNFTSVRFNRCQLN